MLTQAVSLVAAAAIACACTSRGPAPPSSAAASGTAPTAAPGPAVAAPRPEGGLGGTSWQLVRFQSSDDTVLTPDDRARYTIAFAPDGWLSARIDCNVGRGRWVSPGPPQLQFEPLALTRALCPPGSLFDRMVKDWPMVRSYILKDGRLYLSLMADGGIYEFEPLVGAAPPAGGR